MDVDLAILQLGKNNNQYKLNDAKTSIQEWRGSDPEPTADELTKGWSDYQAAQAATKYKRDREAEYPDWKTQLDYIYHHGVAKWKTDIIQPVKDKFPKPS